MLRPKKIHTLPRNLITKKKFLRLENSPPPSITLQQQQQEILLKIGK